MYKNKYNDMVEALEAAIEPTFIDRIKGITITIILCIITTPNV